MHRGVEHLKFVCGRDALQTIIVFFASCLPRTTATALTKVINEDIFTVPGTKSLTAFLRTNGLSSIKQRILSQRVKNAISVEVCNFNYRWLLARKSRERS